MGTVYKPAAERYLYLRYKVDGKWKSRATRFTPEEEGKARALLAELEGAQPQLPATPKVPTFSAYADKWLDARSNTHDAWKEDKAKLRDHVLPYIGQTPLDQVTGGDLVALVNKMKRDRKAPKTIRNVYSVIRLVCDSAVLDNLLKTSPCILKAHHLGKIQDKDPSWRATALFTRDEVRGLVTDPRIPADRRMLYGLLFLGGVRAGEAAGLCWKSVDLEMQPLGRLTIGTSYAKGRTKTGVARFQAIHPVLDMMLTDWLVTGWAQMMEREPTPDDLVVPCPKPTNRGPRKAWGAMRDKGFIWKRMNKDLKLLGFRHRRVHDTRRTFISLAQDDGAVQEILKRGTHATPKTIMDSYTTYHWETLCREVEKLDLSPRQVRKPKRKVAWTNEDGSQGIYMSYRQPT